MWWLFLFCWLLALINVTQCSEKIPYSPGTVCNFEAYYSAQLKVINRFFCVPDSYCRKGVHRFPLMHYDGCDRFMTSPQTDNEAEKLVCCHQEEILEDWSAHWKQFLYLPGVRSFMMCKHHSHAICGPKGSYCKDDDETNAQPKGLPTQISKYPHTALIGFYHHLRKVWIWYCQGSIVSNKYILSVISCNTEDGTNLSEQASNVKIGESRVCPLYDCPDRDEEQNLAIVKRFRQSYINDNSHLDLALFEVSPVIQFNKNVRPACLYYELNTRQSQGWFARYSKPERLIKTRPGRRPIFMTPKYDDNIAFKVKTAGVARILFSKTGLPYKMNHFYFEIVLGMEKNTASRITRSDMPENARTAINFTLGILHGDQFRGFWIHVQPHEIKVGKEDSEDPFLVYNDDATEFDTSAMGLSTQNFEGEWLIYDYKTLATLHDFEMEDTYDDECKEALGEPDNQEVIGDTVFCAKNAHNYFRPCDNDWGGALQIVEDEFYCMWQIYGVYLRDKPSPNNCSVVEKPSLFKLLNSPIALAWVESIIFGNFSITNLRLEQPECTDPDLSMEGRCIKPFYPR